MAIMKYHLKTRRNRDRIVSLVLMGISVSIFTLIPFEIEVVPATVGMDARFFPYLTVIGIFSASLFVFVGTFKKNEKSKDVAIPRLERAAKIRVLGLIAIMLSYIYLIYEIGYYLSTPLVLAALMRYYEMKKWRIIIIICLSLTGIIYFIFARLMNVLLPEGELFR
jgi:hypothetical protein